MSKAVWIFCLTLLTLAGCRSADVPLRFAATPRSQDRGQLDREFAPVKSKAGPDKSVAETSPKNELKEPVPDSSQNVQLAAAELPIVEPTLVPAPAEVPQLLPVETPPEPQPAKEIVPATSGMTLADFEQLALSQNPAILQAAALASKASGIRHQVGRRPNPVVGYQASQLIDRGTDQHLVFVEQDFVLGRKLALSERVMDQEIQVQLWEVEAQRQRVLTDVRQAFATALAAQLRRTMAEEFLGPDPATQQPAPPADSLLLPAELQGIARKGVQRAQERKLVGEGIDIEVLQAEIQLNEVELVQQRALFARSAAYRELAALAGIPCLEEVPLLGALPEAAPPVDWQAKYCELESASPEIRAACMRVARAHAHLDRQNAQPIPNVSVQMAGGYDNGTGSNMMNLQVGVPLPIHNANGGNISAAYAEYCEAGQNLQRLKLQLQQRLAVVARDYDSAAMVVHRYQNVILPKAERTLELSEKGYATQGTVDFLQVLVARRYFFDAMLQLNDAQMELAKTQAMVDGLLLTGGLEPAQGEVSDDGLRGQALSGQ